MTECVNCAKFKGCDLSSPNVNECADYKEILTNEEWFCGLSTEEKAEWFGDWHSFSCVFCKHWQNGCIYNHNQVRCAIEEGKSNKELWMEWLKEIHQ